MTKTQWQLLQAKLPPTWEQAQTLRQTWADSGQKVVFTNGCFDLLHYGHLHYLAQAKDLGQRLIIGLNSDASIRRLKGPRRPIKEELSRKYTLAALSFVDMVLVFEQDTPLELIQFLSPDVLVKGGDWQVTQILGSDWVLARGGSVLSLPFIEGHSTTRLEQKILGFSS